MATTQDDIRRWLERGEANGNSHMIVACDTFDHEDYPVYVKRGANVQAEVDKLRAKEMTKVMEVYSYDVDWQRQINEQRAWHTEVKS